MLVLVCSLMFGTTVCAAGTGDVAGAIEGTWKDASAQIKTVVNKVVFPAIDLILAVFFFAKLGTAYFDYRKHGQLLLLLHKSEKKHADYLLLILFHFPSSSTSRLFSKFRI